MQTAVHSFYSSAAARPGEFDTAINPLLDLALTEANAQGAYLYSVDLENWAARLVVWSGLSPIASTLPVEWQGRSVKASFSREAPLVLHESAWAHPGLTSLPEFQKNRFEGVVSVPILEGGRVAGMLNVCRSAVAALKPREFSFLLSLAVPIGGLLAARHLEREVEKLTQQLADRKVVERAKGLIQSRLEWTEEQAYFCIRNLSRRRRIPMRTIAEEVISSSGAAIAKEEVPHEA